MGQKVQPNGLRLGITKEHNAKWYAGKHDYAQNLIQDLKIRGVLEERFAKCFQH